MILSPADRARRWSAMRAESKRLLLIAGFDPDEPRDEQGKWTDGGGGDGGSEGIESTHVSKPSGGFAPQTFHALKPGHEDKFYKAISAAKAANPHGAAVELHTAAEYNGMRTFLTPDRKAGFALDGDNIVSVFKHPDSTAKGIAKSALALATQQGGKRLDAFDTVLPNLYSAAGFRAVARLPFDEKYAPPGWNKETFAEHSGGKPDVVFMVHDPAHAAPYKAGDGAKVASYDAGVQAQKDALAAIKADTVKRVIASVPGAQVSIDVAKAKLKDGVPSKPANGVYAPEREQWHDKILYDTFTPDRIAAATPAKGEKPTAYLLGGAGGSGKSYFMRAGNIPADKAIYLNSDDVKAALPGYQGWNAPLLHDESSDITNAAEKRARGRGLNVILDGTMGNMAALDKRIADYKQDGYRISGHFMRVKPETAAKRALERFVRGGPKGRYVPPEMLLGHDATPNFTRARGKMDSWEVYDNEGDHPVPVEHS